MTCVPVVGRDVDRVVAVVEVLADVAARDGPVEPAAACTGPAGGRAEPPPLLRDGARRRPAGVGLSASGWR